MRFPTRADNPARCSYGNLNVRDQRASNFEAMRVFSMLMVLMVHTAFFSNGAPSPESIRANTSGMFFYSLVEGLAIVCVNCFVLISGYFGIRPKAKGVFKLLFAIYFYKITLCIYGIIAGETAVGFKSVMLNLLPDPDRTDWFVWAYLGLMLLAPMLNLFVEKATKRSFVIFLVLFFGIEFISSIYNLNVFDFRQGYSAISFIGLYLLARFYRLYLEDKQMRKITPRMGLLIYLAISVIAASQFILVNKYSSVEYLHYVGFSLMASYSSPLVVASSFGVLIFFTKIHFHSKFVNWLGASALSIYLIHLNPNVVGLYQWASQQIFNQ